MSKITVVKSGIYKEIKDYRLAEFKAKGFIELDESGKPKGKEGKQENKNVKELKAELAEITTSHKGLMAEHEKLRKKHSDMLEENTELLKKIEELEVAKAKEVEVTGKPKE